MSKHAIPPFAPRLLAALVALALTLTAVWWASLPQGSAPGSPSRNQVEVLLSAVRTVEIRAKVPGYQRACTGQSACVFGPAWSDTTGAPSSGNGCPTRQDVLARDIRGAHRDPNNGCAVLGGVLADPYSGQLINLAVAGSRGIHIDHVFPLAAAWDLGAATWPAEKRARFANDVDTNLLAVSGSINTAKGDATPGTWLPPDPRRHCFYAARYLSAATAYDLPVTKADRKALTGAVRRCPSA